MHDMNRPFALARGGADTILNSDMHVLMHFFRFISNNGARCTSCSMLQLGMRVQYLNEYAVSLLVPHSPKLNPRPPGKTSATHVVRPSYSPHPLELPRSLAKDLIEQ